MMVLLESLMRHAWAGNIVAIFALHVLTTTQRIRLEIARKVGAILLVCLAFTAGILLFITLNPATASSITWLTDSFETFAVVCLEGGFTVLGASMMLRVLRRKQK